MGDEIITREMEKFKEITEDTQAEIIWELRRQRTQLLMALSWIADHEPELVEQAKNQFSLKD